MNLDGLENLSQQQLLRVISCLSKLSHIKFDAEQSMAEIAGMIVDVTQVQGLSLRILDKGRVKKVAEIGQLGDEGKEFRFPLGTLEISSDLNEAFNDFIDYGVKLIQETLAASAEFNLYRDSVENSLNGFDIVNDRGEFVYANKTYLEMWGYDSFEEIKGKSPVNHCVDPSIPFTIITALKEHGECTIEFLARRKDGSTFNVLMWARKTYAPDGSEIYPTSSLDISPMKKIESDLRESIKARDEFISIVSHELKTPLTSMKLNAQLRLRTLEKNLLEHFEPARLKKLFSTDHQQIDKITRLIDDMLDIARITTGKLSIRTEKFDLCDLCRDVVERFRNQVREENIDISVNLPESAIGNWDKLRIDQVLSNLVSNAIKYGFGTPVVITVEHDSSHTVLKVSDKGRGISEQNIERIFERFERAIPASEISGLGLGLYITRQIVELHGGHVTVQSKIGLGSTFIVTLPNSL